MHVVFMLLSLAANAQPVSPEQQIRNAIATGTGRITLPAGDIEIGAEIVLPSTAYALTITGALHGTTLRASQEFRGRAIFVLNAASGVTFRNFSVDGNRQVIEKRLGLPPYIPFSKFTPNNGILAEGVRDVAVINVAFRNIAGFPILINRAQGIRIADVNIADSGSRDPSGHNNSSGGILLEEGVDDFSISTCSLRNVRGNGIWTHAYHYSPHSHRGRITHNRLDGIGRDAIQLGHADLVTVEANTGVNIGYPVADVGVDPVGIDTAGNVHHCAYIGNHFEEINGKCIDLDGFQNGEVRGNVCVNRQPREHYPNGNTAIVMNNTDPDVVTRNISIVDNAVDGALYGGILVIGSGHTITGNRLSHLNLAHCNDDSGRYPCFYIRSEPDFLRSGIYLRQGASRREPASGNRIEHNRMSGWGIQEHCVVFGPGVGPAASTLVDNQCTGPAEAPNRSKVH